MFIDIFIFYINVVYGLVEEHLPIFFWKIAPFVTKNNKIIDKNNNAGLVIVTQ